MRTFSILDSFKAFNVSGNLTLEGVIKTGIGLVSVEPAETILTGINMLDGNKFTIPNGFHFSIGPEGEVMVLIDEKGRSTAQKLYDFNAMDFKTAYAVAKTQGVNLAPLQAAYLGLGLLVFHNPRKLIPQVRWMRSKGKGRMGIFAFAGKLPKPSWFNPAEGAGSAVQTFEEGDAFFVNELTNEVYVINKKAQAQWANAMNGRLINSTTMPLVTEADLAGCIISRHETETDAQKAAEALVTKEENA